MPYPKQNYFQRRTRSFGARANHYIKAREVQVISSEGKNLGVLNTNEAIKIAKEEGLDLIEISPNANPPVCKIIDQGKYKYEQQKMIQKQQKVLRFRAWFDRCSNWY